MNIIHFDVDEELSKYLKGEQQKISLQQIEECDHFEHIEGISIKSTSQANKANLSHFPKLNFIITRTVGIDHIDLEYCRTKEIAVYNILDYGSFNIAEHVFALLLSGTRNILHSQKEVQKGIFSYKEHLGIALKGKTIGVIGTGKIGLEVIKRAKAFEMDVIAFDVFENEKASHEFGFTYVSLEKLAAQSDIITLHAPLLESTKHMINEDIISQMKSGVILINTARGGLIDIKALIDNASKFRWIGLDVLVDEQHFSKDHPLLKLQNIVITPHIAFYSDESVKIIASETSRIIELYNQASKENRVV